VGRRPGRVVADLEPDETRGLVVFGLALRLQRRLSAMFVFDASESRRLPSVDPHHDGLLFGFRQ
jgi:hypothetical protein